jgi:hypothetical protein
MSAWGIKKSILSNMVKAKQIATPIINAIIWFLVNEEANKDMDENAPPRKILPIYPPMIGPTSSWPINEIEIGYDSVGINIIPTKARFAKNFPMIISLKVTGNVSRVSYDPTLSSSENNLIETAGITKENIKGRSEKKFLKLA